MPKAIVTCGPSYEPIDRVRRLTNFSTGELGVLLSDELANAGFEVVCLRGTGAVYPGPSSKCLLRPFGTNDELWELLRHEAESRSAAIVFHAAALSDFRLKQATDSTGAACAAGKISSELAGLTLHLEPAPKILPHVRKLFPGAVIVGWKYELDGSREQALARAWQQIEKNQTDGCVLNGHGYGQGFAFCQKGGDIDVVETRPELARLLTRWVASRLQ